MEGKNGIKEDAAILFFLIFFSALVSTLILIYFPKAETDNSPTLCHDSMSWRQPHQE